MRVQASRSPGRPDRTFWARSIPNAALFSSVSEFYRLRRHSIADLTAFFGFLVGFLGSGPIAWPFLQVGFQTGEIVKGFTYFIAIICGSGMIGGAIGLALGSAGGWVWERGHRFVRYHHVAPVARRDPGGTGQVAALAAAQAASQAARRSASAPGVPGIRFGTLDPDARSYAAFLRDITGEAHDEAALERALRRTTNVAAWEGQRLVGIARVLTDGHRHAHLVELMVEPAHRRRGIGRELLRRATREVPAAIVVAGAPAAAESLLRRLGLREEHGVFVAGRARAE